MASTFSISFPQFFEAKHEGTHPDVVLAQALPEMVALRIDGHHNVVDSLWNRILPLQVDPCGKVHDAFRQLLHIK